MLLKMVTTTTNSLPFWALAALSGWRKVVYKDYQKAELATSNRQMTCKPSLEMNKKSYTTAFHQHRRGWSGTGGSLPIHGNFKPAISFPSPAPSKPAHHQLITTKVAGKDSDVPYERNLLNTIEPRFQYATWLVNLG